MNDNNNASVLRDCVEFIQEHKKEFSLGDAPFTGGIKEKSFGINEERIFRIPVGDLDRRLAFVDGGTASILSGADFNISLNRVAGVLFKHNKVVPLKKTPEVIEFFTATILEPATDGKLMYNIQLFPREPNFTEFLPDREIMVPLDEVKALRGKFMPDIRIFGSEAMRFAEWKYGTKLIELEMEEKDIFIRDGSLQTSYKNEILLVRELYSIAEEKNVFLTGLSKSCRLITKNGDSLISLVDMIAEAKLPNQPWYYHPIFQIARADNLADVYFVKLHKHARSPFRFDIYLEQSKKLDQKGREDIISTIASNSNDLSFPGYPYGLIKVDQLSRVGVKEVAPQKIQILSEFDSELYNNFILPRIRSIDAHDLLNTLRKN